MFQKERSKGSIGGIVLNEKAPMHVCFFHFSKILIPIGDYIVGKISGQGKVVGIAYLANARGIAFGYKIDEYPFVRYTPHCGSRLGLNGFFANGMPIRVQQVPILCDVHQQSGFKVAFNSEIEFENKFEILLGNSEEKPRGICIGLHVWMIGYNLKPMEGNLLNDSFWGSPVPHKNTVKGDEDIDLGEPKYNPLKIDFEKEEFKLW